MNNHEHWQQVFANKSAQQMSWSQSADDATFLAFKRLGLPMSAHIVEAGCGISEWSAKALDDGYQHLTLIDISKRALEHLMKEHKNRQLENQACRYLELDLSVADSHKLSDLQNSVDCWIDRAVFHFMTSRAEKLNYINKLSSCLKKQGTVVLATFSENGPEKCSNLPVQRYSHEQLLQFLETSEFGAFKCLDHWQQEHTTPWGAPQSFNWWIIQRL
ncbi:class I SAM-dependent methyltransferase [Thalassotalea litorea]|uniref:class I SAM-dependent methyltransferase n=1 Tax=Thalassotalea litorea TaxID=2020715 RepID=UPI003735C202